MSLQPYATGSGDKLPVWDMTPDRTTGPGVTASGAIVGKDGRAIPDKPICMIMDYQAGADACMRSPQRYRVANFVPNVEHLSDADYIAAFNAFTKDGTKP
jgi:hypothetical protein